VGETRRSARHTSPAGGIARATGRWRAIAARDGQETNAGNIRWGVADSRKQAKPPVLDYIQALIWPALIAVGVFWPFRSQLGSLLTRRRVKSVEAAGVKVEVEEVREVLKENLQESREEAAKAEDPAERERAVEKVERDAAALGRIETIEVTRSTHDIENQVIKEAYHTRVGEAAEARGLSSGIRGWLRRQGDDLIRDALIGLVVVVIGFGAAALWDSRLAERQNQLARDQTTASNKLARDLATTSEVQENIRFVRQVAIDNSALKPFRGLNLSGANLGGLDLSCEDAVPATHCADFENANLSGTNLDFMRLVGARLIRADLTGASLFKVKLTRADLRGAKLRGADLSSASLFHANLIGADLTGAKLDDIPGLTRGLNYACYDDTTRWPDRFSPSPPSCG
jgi:hypothetical protein